MMPWLPEQLSAGYARQIAGFQLRVDPDITPFCSGDSQYAGTWNKSRNTCFSVESLVWPQIGEDEGYEVYGDQNGLGLIASTGTINKMILDHPEEKLVVAFDVPKDFLLDKGDYLAVTPSSMEIASGFNFLGYDVSDTTGSTSGFYSFDWSTEDMKFFLTQNQIILNDFGLVANEVAAIRAAVSLCKKFPSHGRFIPIGVWTRKSKGNDFLFP